MEILNSIYRNCADNQGGVRKLYLFPYVKYSRSQIDINDNVLISFPETVVYEFEPLSDYDVQQSGSSNDGGKFFDLNLSFTIGDYKNIELFLKKDFRAVILDRNGFFRLIGTYNGLTCNSINKTSGSAKNDFNGYRLDFTGQEILEAPFFNDLEIITGQDKTTLLSSSDLISSTSVLSSATFY